MKSRNVYSIPIPPEIKIIAISDARAHFGRYKYAIDFIAPLESPVLAALDGIVDEVKIDSNEGGNDPKYADPKFLNYLVLKHDQEEYSLYGHLAHSSTLLRPGDQVKGGDVIAKTGWTGLLTDPHLHFHVFKWLDQETPQTQKIQFDRFVRVHHPTGKSERDAGLFLFLQHKRDREVSQ